MPLFVVAGPKYPPEINWHKNIERIDHLPPGEHREFYSQQRFTLNLTRAEIIEAGLCPSVRLFKAGSLCRAGDLGLLGGTRNFLSRTGKY